MNYALREHLTGAVWIAVDDRAAVGHKRVSVDSVKSDISPVDRFAGRVISHCYRVRRNPSRQKLSGSTGTGIHLIHIRQT